MKTRNGAISIIIFYYSREIFASVCISAPSSNYRVIIYIYVIKIFVIARVKLSLFWDFSLEAAK